VNAGHVITNWSNPSLKTFKEHTCAKKSFILGPAVQHDEFDFNFSRRSMYERGSSQSSLEEYDQAGRQLRKKRKSMAFKAEGMQDVREVLMMRSS
jgi:hypothetical protein